MPFHKKVISGLTDLGNATQGIFSGGGGGGSPQAGEPITGPPTSGDTEGLGAVVVANWKDLRDLIPDFEKRSFQEVITSGIFTGPNAATIHPNFISEMQSTFLEIERQHGLSVSGFTSSPGSAAVLDDKSTLKKILEGPDDTGGGAGRGPTITGASRPDPLGAATILFEDYDRQVAEGVLTADDAAAAWKRDFDVEVRNSEIEAEKFAAQQRLHDTATRRGELEFDILKSSLPVGQQLNLGPFGKVPQNIVNIQDILTQGLPSLANQHTAVGEGLNPITGLPDVAPLQLPDRSALDSQLPGLIEETRAGFPGFVFN